MQCLVNMVLKIEIKLKENRKIAFLFIPALYMQTTKNMHFCKWLPVRITTFYIMHFSRI